MSTRPPYNVPIEASADSGFVLLDGPDGVALSLTPDAAEESARRLAAAAAQARVQLRMPREGLR